MDETEPRQLYIAPWETRFWAWLVDIIVVGAVVNTFWGAVGIISIWTVDPLIIGDIGEVGSLNGVGLWVYWTLFEGNGGQSIGKLVLNIAVTDREGGPIDYGTAAIESFGKAFLLPLDIVIGVIAFGGMKLRLFNRLSKTIVIKKEASPLEPPEGVEYVLPEDRKARTGNGEGSGQS